MTGNLRTSAADFPIGHCSDPAGGERGCAVQRDVGVVRRDPIELELDQHIADCGRHMECAHARFRAHGDPQDRAAACQWLHLQNEAIGLRDRIAGQRRHAEFEQRITDGVDFFRSPFALELGRQTGRLA